MSQEEIAKLLGISRTAYNKYESGVIKPVRKLKELSRIFGVSTDYILGQEDWVKDATAKDCCQFKKYMSLSDNGKDIVDITLEAVYEREKRLEGGSKKMPYCPGRTTNLETGRI